MWYINEDAPAIESFFDGFLYLCCFLHSLCEEYYLVMNHMMAESQTKSMYTSQWASNNLEGLRSKNV